MAKRKKWIIKDFLSQGITLFCGIKSLGKTRLLLNIVKSLARGEEVFEEYKAVKHSVLFIGMKDSMSTMASRLKRACDGEPVPENIEIMFRFPDFGLDLYLANRPDIKLVVIDNFMELQVTKFVLKGLQEITKAHGVAIILGCNSIMDVPEEIKSAADTTMILFGDNNKKFDIMLHVFDGADTEAEPKEINLYW